MKFPGQGLIKNEVEFPRVTKKNNVEFPGVFVFGLEISKGSNTILLSIQGLRIVLSGICRGKVKNENFHGGWGLSKKYILNPPLPPLCLDFLWNGPVCQVPPCCREGEGDWCKRCIAKDFVR